MRDPDSAGLSRRSVLRATGGAATGLALVRTASADGGGNSDGGSGGGNCHYETASMGHHDDGSDIPGSGEHNDPVQRVLCPDHPHAKTGPGHTMKHFEGAAVGGCPGGTGLNSCDEDEEWPDCTT